MAKTKFKNYYKRSRFWGTPFVLSRRQFHHYVAMARTSNLGKKSYYKKMDLLYTNYNEW